MTGLAEVTGALRAACGEGPGLTSRVERARVSAISLADRADSHGWTGVAASMRGAVDALGSVVAELVESQRAGVAALAQLDLIDDQGSAEQVSVYLVAAQRELATAVQKLDAVAGFMDVALDACAQAGQRGLPIALTSLRADLVETRSRLEGSRNACDQERVLVEAWLQESPDQGTEGGDSSVESVAEPSDDGSTPRPAPGTMEPDSDETRGGPSGSSQPPSSQRPGTSAAGAPTVFDRLVDPTGQKRAPQASEPATGFFTLDELKRGTATEPEPRKYSRFSRRLMAAGSLALLAVEATLGSATNLGSSAGQFMAGLFFGTIATIVGVPEFKKVVRETKPKHKPRLTAKERARGED
jgi:hypothetical protein